MESSGFSGKPRNSSRGEDNEGLSESPDQLFDGDNQQLRKEKDESSVLENQTIYTPSASTESLRSDELLSSKAPLLSGQPPSYQDATSIPVEWSQHNLEKGDSPDKARSPDAVKGAKLGITYPRPGKWRRDYSNKPFDSNSPSQDGSGSEESPISRDIIVDTGANPIWGKYPLYDLLSLSTKSGNIAVSIDPHPADPSEPLKPARVVIRSKSGSVSVSFSSPSAASIPEFQRQIELDELNQRGHPETLNTFAENLKTKNYGPDANPTLPSRPYEIDIETVSGSVSGRYIFSTAASIRTVSGSISAQLVPIVSHDPDASASNTTNISLDTSTVSGSTDLHLTEPYFIRDLSDLTSSKKLPLDTQQERPCPTNAMVTSSHTCTGSGSLQISYPQSWAGHVLASSSGHGSVSIGGHGVKLENPGSKWIAGVKEPDVEPGDRLWWGSKGTMDVTVEAKGGGAVQFWVGR